MMTTAETAHQVPAKRRPPAAADTSSEERRPVIPLAPVASSAASTTPRPDTCIARLIGSTGQVAAYAALLRDLSYRGLIVRANTYQHDARAVPDNYLDDEVA